MVLPDPSARKKIVIIGAGFAGIAVAKALAETDAAVALIDRDNYHLFQPLLYQVATAALSPADIAEPIRRMLRGQANCEIIMGSVTGISVADRSISLDSIALSYDILVIAAGATYSYFGHDEWQPFAPGLKTIADARTIRSRLLICFEQAEITSDMAERKRLMTFVIVGGGPSGVELASSIAELARHTLAKDFHRIDPRSAQVILLEAGPNILSAFPKRLSRYASNRLSALGVEVRVNCAVTCIAKEAIEAGGQRIASGLTMWAAGVQASAVGRMLGALTDKSGRIEANQDLSIPGHPDIYALGDIAMVKDANGNTLPGLAQVATQQGDYLGRALAEKLKTGAVPKPFAFRNRGNVAIIGRHSAVADFGWMRLTGVAAWLLWAIIHIYLLAGLQHRVQVAIQWLWRYVTYDRGARLILQQARPSALDPGQSC